MIPDWYEPALTHAEADKRCGREWSCGCGACRQARRHTECRTAFELLSYGAKRGAAWRRAMERACA